MNSYSTSSQFLEGVSLDSAELFVFGSIFHKRDPDETFTRDLFQAHDDELTGVSNMKDTRM